ncbi:MAG: ABC transporter permease [Granulosicoccaceae bacterium]
MKRLLAATLPLAAIAVPVLAGLGLTIALAFGTGTAHFSARANALQQMLQIPSIKSSVLLSLWTAWGSTLVALSIALCLGYWITQSRLGQKLKRTLPALLSVPHAAFAVGFYFLISPSGWLARLFSPWLSGWSRPPDLATVQDPWGIALLLGLAIKETPFLLLTLLAALGQTNCRQSTWLGQSLGYSPWRCWLVLVVPQLYKQMRLPLIVVLSYGLSVVDMAKVLGPAIPGTLAVQSTLWLHDPDPSKWPLGAASALLLVLLSLTSVLAWLSLERLIKPLLKAYWLNGNRRAPISAAIGKWLIPPLWMSTIAASLSVIVLWSLTWRWRFPDALPQSFSLQFWGRHADQLLTPAWNTLSLGLASTAISLIAAVALLESVKRLRLPHLSLLYAPLLLPQLAFLFGVQLLLLKLQADGRWWSVVWVHALFVFPYIVLALHGPWQAYDQRYTYTALALGKSRWQVWWSIKRPILLKPLVYASALGFSVSVAQYLSTLFVGAGRFPTLTTEAIAMVSGGDRRTLAATAFVQMTMPMLAFALAFALPNILYKNRKHLRDEA